MSLNARYVTRVRITAAVLLIVALIIIGRLWILQVLHGGEYERRADAQSVALENPLLNRGSIYFSTKDGAPVLAATLAPPSASSSAQRYYPGGELAAQTLGFVAYNNDNT